MLECVESHSSWADETGSEGLASGWVRQYRVAAKLRFYAANAGPALGSPGQCLLVRLGVCLVPVVSSGRGLSLLNGNVS